MKWYRRVEWLFYPASALLLLGVALSIVLRSRFWLLSLFLPGAALYAVWLAGLSAWLSDKELR